MSAITSAAFAGMGLPELIGSIQWEFEKAEKAAETALGHGINCGHALNTAKQKVPHGSWMKWIEDNTTIPHSTVNMFMTLASNSQRVENSESIRGALKLLADDKAEVRRRQVSETYIPYDGETAPAPAPAPPPRQPSAPVTLEAEIVQPSIKKDEPPSKPSPEPVPPPIPVKPNGPPPQGRINHLKYQQAIDAAKFTPCTGESSVDESEAILTAIGKLSHQKAIIAFKTYYERQDRRQNEIDYLLYACELMEKRLIELEGKLP